jgi:hypothetical protein
MLRKPKTLAGRHSKAATFDWFFGSSSTLCAIRLCQKTKGILFMKCSSSLALAGALLAGFSAVALADNVRTDYDHTINFAQYQTYS